MCEKEKEESKLMDVEGSEGEKICKSCMKMWDNLLLYDDDNVMGVEDDDLW